MIRSWFARTLVVVVAGVAAILLAARVEAQQPPQKIDLRYIPQDAVGAAVTFPKRWKSNPDLELLPFEVMTAAGQQEFGFDPLEIEQAIGIVGAPTLEQPPLGGLILRFGTPQTLSNKILEQTEAAQASGQTYRRGRPISYCLIEGRTLLVAPEPYLLAMLQARDADSPLLKLLRSADFSSDLTGVVAFDPLRDLVKQGLANAPPVPPPLQPLLAIPDQLTQVHLQVNMSGPRATTVVLTAKDNAAATAMGKSLQAGIGFAKQMILAQVTQEMQRGEDPLAQSAMQYILRLADVVERRFQPQVDGNRVVLSVQTDYATTGVLISLLLPAVQAAREAARRMSSSNNLKQIAIALHNYHDAYRRLPAAATFDTDRKPLLSWRVRLLPFLDQQELYNQFHLDEPWDSEHNRALIERMPAVYQNPNLAAPAGQTNYVALAGKGGLFEGTEGLRFADVRDGLSNTIMAVEADADRAVIWTKPDDLAFDPRNPLVGLGHLRPGGFQAVLADGSVRFIALSIDPAILKALFTRGGGEVIDPTRIP